MKPTFPPLIILAAGRSSRMGWPKGLLTFADHYWIEELIDRFVLQGGGRVVIVLGDDFSIYQTALAWLNPLKEGDIGSYGCDHRQSGGCKVSWVINRRTFLGQFSSLQCGLKGLPAQSSAVFILPIDTPLPKNEAICQKLWRAWCESDQKGVVQPIYEGRGGHPVLIGEALIHLLSSLDPEDCTSRLDYILRALPLNERLKIVVDASEVTLNLNHPEIWRCFCESELGQIVEATPL